MRLLKPIILGMVMVLAIASTAFANLCPDGNATPKIASFDFFVDYSGSMMMHHQGLKVEKIVMAKQIMDAMNAEIPDLGYSGSMHTFAPYGELIPQSGGYDKAAFSQAIASLRTDYAVFGRLTPMGDGIADLGPVAQGMSKPAAIILFTDGDNNRGNDPVAEARRLYEAAPDAVIHIVSFADTENGKAILDQIAAMKSDTVYVSALDLMAEDGSALRQFVMDVFYTCGEDESIMLHNIQFAFDSAELDSTARGLLNEAAYILQGKTGQIVVAGHTCNIGTDQYNQRLSERRANSVRQYLISKGIDANRLSAVGYGESRPKYSNDTEETRRLNRRVEISIQK